MSKGDESDSADDDPEGLLLGKLSLPLINLDRNKIDSVIPDYIPKSSQNKKRKK